jgi:hypothetical protein
VSLKRAIAHKLFHLVLALFCSVTLLAQRKPGNIIQDIGGRVQSGGGAMGSGGNDSLKSRSKFEDSVTLTIYYIDSSRGARPDSSVSEFTRRFPIPTTHAYLGNSGSATRSILFAPELGAGFDPGFHAYDVYKWRLDRVRFFNTTRPYTELGYMLASRSEQLIEIFHTQNIKPYWNFSFGYRLLNAPGIFRNQTTNHNNYSFTSWYQSKKKRYNNYIVLLGNRLQAGENGGIQDQTMLDEADFAKDRFLIPTKLGGSPVYGNDFFNTTLITGNQYREFNFLLRQQYDLGKKDSIVTDSLVIPLFFPRLRFEHTFNYGLYKYKFMDNASSGSVSNLPDPVYYDSLYLVKFKSGESVYFRDKWKELTNDFSIYQFPDAKNLAQFFKLGAQFQLLKGEFIHDSLLRGTASLVNAMAHAEYRNKTRNGKWDMLAFGKLYLAGYNLGDFHAYVSLQRFISQKIGSLKLGFENANRTPSFIYDQRSGFYFDDPKSFSRQNTTHFFGALFIPRIKTQLSADYYLFTNYLYLNNYRSLQQEATLFNVLRINALKTFKVGRRWNWHAELYLQRETGDVEVNMPVVFTRHRFMYEGNLGFRSLNIAMGVEARYHTPYKADDYSPLIGSFFYQDTVTISNLPDINAFIHFRIRTFKAYFRLENLNTLRTFGGLQFNNNNLSAPNYPTPGLILRFGVYWTFVN